MIDAAIQPDGTWTGNLAVVNGEDPVMLTDRERSRGDDYIKVMDANLAKLRRALGCT